MSEKIIARKELTALGQRLRASGAKIALANGCFDLLHVGHVRYLQASKQQADVLVVAVNSDRAVMELKGPGRPVMDEAGRAELMAALECVDFVVVFDDLSAEGILRDLRPDVQCKGTDYSEFGVPEQQVIESLGGVARITGDPKNHSTREILAEIRRRYQK